MRLMTLSLLSLMAVRAAAPFAQEKPQVFKPGNGVVAPTVVSEVKPNYTADAMQRGITGTVRMECVVLPDGTPGEIRVVEALDPALDASAIAALEQWRFNPGTKDGKAVPVAVEVEMSFSTLQGPRLDSPNVFKPGPGITQPTAVAHPSPGYTAAARAARIQGSVLLDCVVLTNGRVGEIRVTKHLDPELDAEAIRTLKEWRFTPGEREGQPVPVQVKIEMTFTLR